MHTERAQRFPVTTRSKFAEWQTYVKADGTISLRIRKPDDHRWFEIALNPDDFYSLTEDIRRRYDEFYGI